MNQYISLLIITIQCADFCCLYKCLQVLPMSHHQISRGQLKQDVSTYEVITETCPLGLPSIVGLEKISLIKAVRRNLIRLKVEFFFNRYLNLPITSILPDFDFGLI